MDAVSNYQPKNVVVNMNASRLARICAKQSVRERAFFGAGIYLGKVHVRGVDERKMTQTLAAILAGSTPLNVYLAVKQLHLRKEILEGKLPLQPRCISAPSIDNGKTPSIDDEEIPEVVVTERHESRPTYEEVEQTEQVELEPPSEKFLTRLAKMVGVDAWLRAGVAADL